MNIRSASEFVSRAEDFCSELDFSWQGFNTWPAIKIVLYSILLRYEQPPILKSSSSLRRFMGKLKKYAEPTRTRLYRHFVDYFLDPHGMERLGPADALYLTRDFAKQILLNGRWCDVLFPALQDGVSRAGGRGPLMLEVLINPQQIRLPRHTPCALLHMPSARKRAFQAYRDQAQQFLRQALEGSFLQSELTRIKCTQYYDFFLQRSASMLGAIAAYSPFYEAVLKKVNPKIVFLRCYYSAYSLPLLLACKRMDIATADMQHGLQYPEHVAYGGWSKVTPSGYELLPDYFLTWSDHEVGVIKEWSKQSGGAHKAIPTGHPWLEAWCADLIPGIAEFKRQAKALTGQGRFSRTILFTQQPVPGNLELCLRAFQSSPPDWLWLIRCHPTLSIEARRRVENCLSKYPNVNIEDATRLPLPALLEIADLHVTQCSSSSIEAASIGIPSIVLHQDGVRHLPHISPEILRLSEGGSDFAGVADEMLIKRKLLCGAMESFAPNSRLTSFLEGIFATKPSL